MSATTVTSTAGGGENKEIPAFGGDVKLPESIVDALPTESFIKSGTASDIQMRIRRSRSIGNLNEYKSQLQRFEKFVWALPAKIKSQHHIITGLPRRLSQRNKRFAAEKMSENKLGDVGPQLPVDPTILAVCVFPFVPLCLYALFTVALSTIVGYLFFLLLYLLVLVAFFVCEVAIRPPWYKPTTPEQGLTNEQLPSYWQGIFHNPKYNLNLDYEDVEFTNPAGLVLRGWFVPAAPNAARATRGLGMVCVHGGGRDRRAWLRHVPMFHNRGYDVLLFDFSEHGVSDGTKRGFSFGIREKDDVMAAVRFMKEQKGLPRVVVLGTSVGGSSAIMAAAEDPTIDGVIAENPVACVEEFALFHLKRMIGAYAPKAAESIWMKPLYTLVSRILLLRIGAPFGYTRPYQLIAGISPRPVMLMHGTADDLVPIDHSTRLHSCANEPKYLWLAKDAWHCALYDQHPEEYGRRIAEFVDRHFKEDEEEGKEEEEEEEANKEKKGSLLLGEEDQAKNEEAAAKIQAASEALTQDEGTATVTTEKEAQALQEVAGEAVEQ